MGGDDYYSEVFLLILWEGGLLNIFFSFLDCAMIHRAPFFSLLITSG